MADRTIKPDDTNDLVLQNNDGSAKIEINEAQTVVLTGGSTTALTIDTSGNTTLAGTANDIGTVTSGTFNGYVGGTFKVVASGTISLTINTYTTLHTVSSNQDGIWFVCFSQNAVSAALGYLVSYNNGANRTDWGWLGTNYNATFSGNNLQIRSTNATASAVYAVHELIAE